MPSATATTPGRHPLRALADRLPAHRRRPDRALQLALRPPRRRHLPAQDRGHRPRPLDARGDGGDPRRPDLARPRLGRRADQPVRARRPPRRGGAARWSRAAPPTAAMRPSRRSRPSASRRRPRADRRSSARPGATPTPRPGPTRPYVVRLRAPREGETVVDDVVQGRVTWKNETLDDLILLRSDGTPTYMLAVVVDDHDMGVTHVIRGDDHLTNAARQTLIYRAMDWEVPVFAHIPLIHGADGAKLSKRHGALGIDAYRDMGYPARGDAQLPGAARLEPRQRRVLHHRAGDRLVRPRPSRQGAGAIRLRQARERCPASTSVPPTTRRCSPRSRPILQRKTNPHLSGGAARPDARRSCRS